MPVAKKRRGIGSAGRSAEPDDRGRLRALAGLSWIAVGIVVALGAFLYAKEQATGGGEAVPPPATGLPHTPDYHSLLVDASDPERLLLGTHVGVYESTDGGRSWRFAALEGKDAMHLARERDGTVWAAGHYVLERSEDGGESWRSVRPTGLPDLDVHGFAIDPRTGVVYAAVAGDGLYRSDDEGATFRRISRTIGPGVVALAVTRDGALFAADAKTGVYVSANGADGWRRVLAMVTAGLAANDREPPGQRVLAAGTALRVSADGSAWETVLEVGEGVGPVAFAPSAPRIAYAVGFDRTLYRSDDGGRSWAAVS